ncbi:MAG: hypothetical protein P8J79_03620 [Halioglobus sp.]|nr:hypothetical protein [Halioglobus sp.]
MTERYNVYFAGRLVEGHDLDTVREELAKLFNADQQTLDKLFNGEVQLIKSGCDKATAIKYKIVMQRAGAEPTLAKVASASKQANDESIKAHTAETKIAALAAAPVNRSFDTPGSIVKTPTMPQEATPALDGIGLSPVGTDVLQINERAAPINLSVDTSALTLNTLGQRLSQKSSSPPAMPDTSHLKVAKVGDIIPNLLPPTKPASPNIDNLMLSPLNFDFRDDRILE